MKRAALTLVELVLTMSLTLILASVAIGALVGVQTWRQTAGVRRIAADIAYARAEAMLSGRRTMCRFNLGMQEYTLLQEAQPATGKIDGAVMNHPGDETPWQIRASELGSDLSLHALHGVDGRTFGFATTGLPVNENGHPLRQDVRLDLSNGVQVVVRGETGVCEVIWP